MSFFVLSISYKKIPVHLREKLSIDPSQMDNTQRSLHSKEFKFEIQKHDVIVKITESVLLSTCNRTEIFGFIEDKKSSDDFVDSSLIPLSNSIYTQLHKKLLSWIYSLIHEHDNSCCLHRDISNNDLDNCPINISHSVFLTGVDAHSHLIKLASGMDSMIIGENQIFSQIKKSFFSSLQNGFAGKKLRVYFENAFSSAKKVRHESRVNENPVSVAYASTKILKNIFASSLSSKKVLFVGAGEMISLIARYLSYFVYSSTFINRTKSKAQDLASLYNGEVVDFSDRLLELDKYDILISCTASQAPIFLASQLIDKSRLPEVMLDLAVPRDIEFSEQLQIKSHLISIDNLSKYISEFMVERKKIAEKFEVIIDGMAMAFVQKQARKKELKIIYKHAMHMARNFELLESYEQGKRVKSLENLVKSVLFLPTKLIENGNFLDTNIDVNEWKIEDNTSRFTISPVKTGKNNIKLQ